MIPILYPAHEADFNTQGLGRLADAVECIVTEERNGIYELEMTFPLTGKRYADINVGAIIGARHDDAGDVQPFRIYKITRPISGLVKIYARHISYDLNKIVVRPFSAESLAQTLEAIPQMAVHACPFTFWTDKTVTAPFSVVVPTSVRSILGGSEGSILDVYGTGEYEFDGYAVKLHLHRGTDHGVTIRYGKNLVDLEAGQDGENAITAALAFWRGTDEEGNEIVVNAPYAVVADLGTTEAYVNEDGVQYTNEDGVVYEGTYNPMWATPLDLSEQFEAPPTEAQLLAAAQAWLEARATLTPEDSLDVNFVALWQTNEYAEYAPLQQLNLCDTVRVLYPKLGVEAEAEVVKVEYDVLTERYTRMTIGEPKNNLAQTIANTETLIADVMKKTPTLSRLDAAIEAVKNVISGGVGGNVVIGYAPDGHPNEILFMDTDDKATARNVIRLNAAGIGFSTSGYEGPYNTALTIDGHIVANYIDTGVMSADVIRTGTMRSEDGTVEISLGGGEVTTTGTKTVTTQVETGPGQFAPVEFILNTKTELKAGEIIESGERDGGDMQPLAQFGVSAEGMTYDWYQSASADSWQNVAFAYGGVEARGETVQGYADTDSSGYASESGKAATYKPLGKMGPDRIQLGLAEDIQLQGATPVGDEVPDRNVLELAGGWNTVNEAIQYKEYYDFWYDEVNDVYYKTFRTTPIIHRGVFAYAPGDYAEASTLYVTGLLTNSRQDLRVLIPLSRPVDSDVTDADMTGYLTDITLTVLQGSQLATGTLSALGVTVARAAITDIGIDLWLRRSAGWGGTNNSPVALFFQNFIINFA